MDVLRMFNRLNVNDKVMFFECLRTVFSERPDVNGEASTSKQQNDEASTSKQQNDEASTSKQQNDVGIELTCNGVSENVHEESNSKKNDQRTLDSWIIRKSASSQNKQSGNSANCVPQNITLSLSNNNGDQNKERNKENNTVAFDTQGNTAGIYSHNSQNNTNIDSDDSRKNTVSHSHNSDTTSDDIESLSCDSEPLFSEISDEDDLNIRTVNETGNRSPYKEDETIKSVNESFACNSGEEILKKNELLISHTEESIKESDTLSALHNKEKSVKENEELDIYNSSLQAKRYNLRRKRKSASKENNSESSALQKSENYTAVKSTKRKCSQKSSNKIHASQKSVQNYNVGNEVNQIVTSPCNVVIHRIDNVVGSSIKLDILSNRFEIDQNNITLNEIEILANDVMMDDVSKNSVESETGTLDVESYDAFNAETGTSAFLQHEEANITEIVCSNVQGQTYINDRNIVEENMQDHDINNKNEINQDYDGIMESTVKLQNDIEKHDENIISKVTENNMNNKAEAETKSAINNLRSSNELNVKSGAIQSYEQNSGERASENITNITNYASENNELLESNVAPNNETEVDVNNLLMYDVQNNSETTENKNMEMCDIMNTETVNKHILDVVNDHVEPQNFFQDNVINGENVQNNDIQTYILVTNEDFVAQNTEMQISDAVNHQTEELAQNDASAFQYEAFRRLQKSCAAFGLDICDVFQQKELQNFIENPKNISSDAVIFIGAPKGEACPVVHIHKSRKKLEHIIHSIKKRKHKK